MPITDTSIHFDTLDTILDTLRSMYYTVNTCFDISAVIVAHIMSIKLISCFILLLSAGPKGI